MSNSSKGPDGQAPTHNFSIVLHHPEIPGNTGSIGRTCVALGIRLILIRPYGFDLSEKAVRRAGLDYWKYVKLTEYDSFDEFLVNEQVTKENLFLFSRFAQKSFFRPNYPKGCFLVFGSETQGLPERIKDQFLESCVTLPTFSKEIRSLNLANTVTAAAYQALNNQSSLNI